jgi:hypothetical protein
MQEHNPKWVGFDNTHNSWEPYKNVRDVKVLHEYFQTTNRTNLIPKKIQNVNIIIQYVKSYEDQWLFYILKYIFSRS